MESIALILIFTFFKFAFSELASSTSKFSDDILSMVEELSILDNLTSNIINQNLDSTSEKPHTSEKPVNLNDVQKKLSEDELYEHVSEKVNVSEKRSFIFIHGSKFKVSYLNRLQHSVPDKVTKNKFKTFINNFDNVEQGNAEDPHTRSNIGEGYPEVKSPQNPNLYYAPAIDAYSSGSLANYMEDEMNGLAKKIKNVNTGNAVQQHYDKSRMTMNVKQTYLNKKKPIDVLRNPSMQMKSIQTYDNYTPVPGIYSGVSDHIPNEMIDPKSKPLYPGEKSRDYLELLKPPMLRAKPVKIKSSSVYSKHQHQHHNQIQLPHHYQHQQNQLFQQVNLNPYQQPNYNIYGNANAPYRMKNDVRSQNQLNEGDNNLKDDGGNHDDFHVENNEEPEFHDARLINKIEEMKSLDAALFDDNSPRESVNEDLIVKDKNMKGNSRPKPKCMLRRCNSNSKFFSDDQSSKKDDGASEESVNIPLNSQELNDVLT